MQRVERELHQVIGTAISQQFPIQSGIMISVSRVLVSPDLRTARVYLTVFGTIDFDKAELLEEITDMTGDIGAEIKNTMRMKFHPKLQFIWDEGQEKRLTVDKKIDEISKEINQSVAITGESGDEG